jgi:hypothetical protein
MPNNTVPAAARGLPEINRRRFLLSAAATGAVATVAVAPVAEAAVAPQANPKLVALFGELKEAVVERAAAKDAKEWIVDEWWHRWPLAPDVITLPGYAEWDKNREVDLAGRPMKRPGEAHARRLRSLEDLAWLAERMASNVENARNEKRRASAMKALAEDRRSLRLGEEYYREIEHIREASGIRSADARIAAAGRELNRLCNQIMAIPARSSACLSIKAKVVELWCEEHSYLLQDDDGIFGWPCRLANDILSVAAGGVS